MSHSSSILVIGAGMAGMACARTLKAHGHAVTVLESSNRVGGRLGGENVDGNWLDHGFQVSMSNYHALESLVPRNVVARHPFISGAIAWTGRKQVRILDPRRHPFSAMQPLLAGLVGFRDLMAARRCRSLGEEAARGETLNGTANDIMERCGFGQRFQDVFLRPFFGGVFLDEDLDVSAGRFLRTLHRFANGAAELPAGSMQQLAEAMAEPIRADIQTGRRVVSLTPGSGVTCADGETIEADRIVIATEFDHAAALLGGSTEDHQAEWSGTIACHFSSPRPIIKEPLIVLNGSGEGRINLVCSPTAVAPGYRTDGQHAVLVSLRPFNGAPPAVDIDAIADEAGRILQTDSSSWTWSRNDVVTRSLPRMQTPASMPAPPPGTWLAGDWTADPSIETAVGSGIIVARQILATD